MIAGLKPYPEYRESGLAWAPRIPAHWFKERAKRLFRKMERPVRAEDDVVTCFRDGMVTLRKNRRLAGFTEALYEFGYQGVRKGDLVIHAMDAFAGAVGVSDSDGKGTPVYAVCQPTHGVNAHYYAFIVREMARSHWILALSRGIRERSTDFRYEAFGVQPVPLPPLFEQAAIVRFLDWANGRLERAIRAKRKVIALLNEQKQAIIHRAVTRGLDLSAPLKLSGIPWLGDIPIHWRVVRNLALFACRVEPGIPGLPVLQVSLHSGITTEELDQFGRPKRLIADHTRYKLVRKDDLAYNTMRMWQGAVGVSATDGLVSPAYVVATPRGGVESKFYEFVFRTTAYKQQVNRYSTGIVSDRNRLYWEGFKQMPNVLLPLEEQRAICRFILEETAALNSTISRLEREIELLREYRTRLVADVVTGKLDVREAAARLPDEAVPDVEEEYAALNDETEASDEEIGS
jgi:type I restriction enzyme, S subunit